MGQGQVVAINWPALAVIVTFGFALAGVIFHAGSLAARVQAIESWKLRMRDDMHEVSEQMQTLTVEIRQLRTLIEERTERRGRAKEHDVD